MFDLIKETSLEKNYHYSVMLEDIHSKLPAIHEAFGHFGKHQSQFMDNFLTVSHPTPLRNARQCLAEMNRLLTALREAQYKLSKKKIYIKRLEQKLEAYVGSELDQEELELKIDFKKSEVKATMLYVEAAVRSIKNYADQYDQILKNAGYPEMTEEAFEAEEEAYHIMKAFDQAICAARSRGGVIDEGNHIYLSQLGVNGSLAQRYVSDFFRQEAEEDPKELTPAFTHDFLKHMAKEFKGCSNKIAKIKGMLPTNPSAILKEVELLRRKA